MAGHERPRRVCRVGVLQKNWISDIFTAMKTHVSAAQAAHTFADLVNRVYYRGEIFVIERDGTPVCQLVPIHPPRCTVAELVQLLRRLPAPDEAYWQLLEALTQQQPALPPSPWPC
jgi:antitoxin (DNA-binding transcriptional repressor) of toxin-antitoxin stability system